MNRTIFITAISSDVGIQYVHKYHSSYERIIGQYRTKSDALNTLKDLLGRKLFLIQADLMNEEAVESMIQLINKKEITPDCILHLPSLKYETAKFHKISQKRFKEQMEVQLYSALSILQSFLPSMSKKRYGKVVLMLSSVVKENAPKYLSEYTIAKYALLGLLKSISSEYADKGITVNGISPGMMETKLLSEVPELIYQQNALANPQKRNVRISDILPIIHFLLSDESVFVTGQNVIITGGQ